MLITLLDLLTVIVAFWAINKMSQAVTGKTLKQRFLDSRDDKVIEVGVKDVDYVSLLNKFCKLSGMSLIEVFLLARTEKGFGHSDERVNHHLKWYIKDGEIPNYVESFLEDGRNYIYNA